MSNEFKSHKDARLNVPIPAVVGNAQSTHTTTNCAECKASLARPQKQNEQSNPIKRNLGRRPPRTSMPAVAWETIACKHAARSEELEIVWEAISPHDILQVVLAHIQLLRVAWKWILGVRKILGMCGVVSRHSPEQPIPSWRLWKDLSELLPATAEDGKQHSREDSPWGERTFRLLVRLCVGVRLEPLSCGLKLRPSEDSIWIRI